MRMLSVNAASVQIGDHVAGVGQVGSVDKSGDAVRVSGLDQANYRTFRSSDIIYVFRYAA